jgi:rRNA biogenesis protein RRP5
LNTVPSPEHKLFGIETLQEVKQGDAGRIRGLFERATSLQLPPKKMKFLFKRWLEYEGGRGDQGTC